MVAIEERECVGWRSKVAMVGKHIGDGANGAREWWFGMDV